MASADPAFPLIEVSGSAYEMGYQHGEQAAQLIRRHTLWIEKLSQKPVEVLSQNAIASLPSIQALSPSFVQEVRGLADGAGISLGQALLCQARTEAAHHKTGGCTAFALTGSATADGQTLAGQNQDLESEYSDVAILLRVKPDDGRPEALMFTFAGQLGYAGMNEHGLAHFNTALYDYQWRLGLPRQPLKRVLLERRTVDECVILLAQHRVCSAANMVFCDRQRNIADVEIRPEATALLQSEHPDCRLHTNHYMTPQFAPYETHSLADSGPRLDRLRALVQENWGRITVETMKSILADHQGDPGGICRHGAAGWHSISGYIAEPSRGLLHVRRGHGCLGTWQTYQV